MRDLRPAATTKGETSSPAEVLASLSRLAKSVRTQELRREHRRKRLRVVWLATSLVIAALLVLLNVEIWNGSIGFPFGH
jgi:hypothetical protein